MKSPTAVLSALSVLSVITYLDRVCISAVGPRMQADLAISPEQWGWVMGVFLITYSALEIPSGALGDRLGHRGVIGRIVLWWSAFTSLTGAVSNFYALLLTRLLFGAGEAGAYPNMSGVISRWFPREQRARAQGCIWACSRVGGAITPLVVVPLAATVGWRVTFYAFGALGAIWAAVWLWRYREPVRPVADVGVASSDPHRGIPWRALFANPQLWLIMAMYWCYVWGSIFYLTWFHTYLVKGRGLSEAEMGLYASFPFILGVAGNLFGGWLSDRLVATRGPGARRLVGSVCLALSAIMLCAVALTRGKLSGVILLTLGFGIMDCMVPSAWAICLDVGKRYAGAVSGAMNTAGNAGGFICSVLFGYLVTAFDSYHAPIFLIAAMVMISALLFWRIDATRPLVEEPTPVAPPAMRLGLSSYAYGWAIGVRGFPCPESPLSASGLLDRAAGFGIQVVQIADNLPLDGLSSAQLDRLVHQALEQRITLELGVRGILTLPAHIAFAARLGARVLRTVIDSTGHHPEVAEIVTRLRAVAPECERHGLTLAIENHDRFKAAVLDNIFQQVGSTHVGLCLDTANSLGCMEGPDHLLTVLGPRVVNLHIKDVCIHRLPHQFGFTVEGRPAGQGQLDIPSLLKSLGHPGSHLSAILELWPAPEATISATVQKEAIWVEQSIRYLRTLITD